MASNIEWLAAENEDAKIVVWAHNGHVQDKEGLMGSYLRKAFGKSYLNVAFTSSHGTYYAIGRGTKDHVFRLQDPPPDSFEAILEASELPICIVDIRQAEKGDPGSTWLKEWRSFGGNIGALSIEKHYSREHLAKHYDLLVYIRETSAAHQLSTPPGR